MEKLLKLINKYDQIALYRHVNPDFDAFGSQFGMYWTLKEMFPNKKIVTLGDNESSVACYFKMEDNQAACDVPTLGIVLDTANIDRIDGDYSFCDELVKIDHHIIIDSYGDYNIEIPTASSCSEIVTLLLKSQNINIPLYSAEALYLGIVGDSNRFLYNSTTQSTFEAASYLLDMGICIEKLYQNIYLRKQKDLDITRHIYNSYEYDSGVAWYCLKHEDLLNLGISREQGSNYVNSLANIEEFKVWLAITENKEEGNFRVSIRSRELPINEIAAMYNGGGHKLASGATIASLDELPGLIQKIKEEL